MVISSITLFVSLFLPWSHQFTARVLAVPGAADALRGVPSDPTAWQVYSIADAMLAVVASALFLVALVGPRPVRITVLVGVLVALAFSIHAASVPPTNGVQSVVPSLGLPAAGRSAPTPGPGTGVAIVALAVATAGLGLSLSAD